MLAARLVEPVRVRETFERIEPQLYHFPAVDPPPSFRNAVHELFGV